MKYTDYDVLKPFYELGLIYGKYDSLSTVLNELEKTAFKSDLYVISILTSCTMRGVTKAGDLFLDIIQPKLYIEEDDFGVEVNYENKIKDKRIRGIYHTLLKDKNERISLLNGKSPVIKDLYMNGNKEEKEKFADYVYRLKKLYNYKLYKKAETFYSRHKNKGESIDAINNSDIVNYFVEMYDMTKLEATKYIILHSEEVGRYKKGYNSYFNYRVIYNKFDEFTLDDVSKILFGMLSYKSWVDDKHFNINDEQICAIMNIVSENIDSYYLRLKYIDYIKNNQDKFLFYLCVGRENILDELARVIFSDYNIELNTTSYGLYYIRN